MANEDPSRNPFVRFKQHVDASISAGLGSIFGLNSTPGTQPLQEPIPSNGPQHEQMNSPDMSSSSLRRDSTTSRLSDAPFEGTQQAVEWARGGVTPAKLDAEEMQDWQHFLLWSAYSPLNARHLLPMDVVTAFEDLLYAASGQDMPDRFDRTAARPCSDENLPLKPISPEVEWFGRLQKAGVLKAWPVKSYRHLYTPEGPTWVDIMKKESEKQIPLPADRNPVLQFDSLTPEEYLAEERSKIEAFMRSSMAYRRAREDEFGDWFWPEWKLQARTDAHAQFQLEKERSKGHLLQPPPLSAAQDSPSPLVPQTDKETQVPETEEAAYSWLASAVKKTQQSMDRLVSAANKPEAKPDTKPNKKGIHSNSNAFTTDPHESGYGCDVPGSAYSPEMVREWTDEFGNHCRVKETWVAGPDGVQICMREESMTQEIPGKIVTQGSTRTYLAEQRPEAQDGYLRTEIEKRRRVNNARQNIPRDGTSEWHDGKPPQKGSGWFW
jgi:hypothetical protein